MSAESPTLSPLVSIFELDHSLSVAVITLDIEISPLQVLAEFDVIRVYRSTGGISGTYTEITDQSTRIAVVSTQSLYEFLDRAGDPTYFYRIDFYNTTTELSSEAGEPMRGEQDPANSVITPAELKEIYLFGLDLTDAQGKEFPPAMIEHYIRAAVRTTERNLDVPLRRKVVSDISPEAEKEAFGDYIQNEWYNYFYARLPEYPIISVESARIVFANNLAGFDFPPEWIRLDRDSGQLWIVPDGQFSNLLRLGFGFTGWLPFARSAVGFVPGIYRISYTAGLDPIPEDVKHLVGMRAALGPLNVAGDLIVGAGIASTSLSIDGLSQSIGTTSSATNSGYGARIIQYQKEIKTLERDLRLAFKGLKLTAA